MKIKIYLLNQIIDENCFTIKERQIMSVVYSIETNFILLSIQITLILEKFHILKQDNGLCKAEDCQKMYNIQSIIGQILK